MNRRRILHVGSNSGRCSTAASVIMMFVIALLPASQALAKEKPPFVADVVSSAADQVTGGDARLHIVVPKVTPFHQVEVLVNGVNQADRFSRIDGTQVLTGVIDGLALGDNMVVVKQHGKGKGLPEPAVLTLTNYPITGPVFSGPHQNPFMCSVQNNGLGQPLVDNPTEGFPVYATDPSGYPTDEIIGYSMNCSADTLVTYVYKATDGAFKPYMPGDPRPADMAQTTTMDGLTVDYVVRWERGTINRFLYSIAMLAPFDEGPDDLDTSAWNGKADLSLPGRRGDRPLPGQPERQQDALRQPVCRRATRSCTPPATRPAPTTTWCSAARPP